MSIRVMSCNIRTSTAADGGDSWERRRGLCLDIITSRRPDIVCFQEMSAEQCTYMISGMPGHVRVGSPDRPGRGDPLNSIFFRRERFEALDSGAFWLSRRPEVPGSKLFGSKYPRYASWALLRDGDAGLLVVDTHLDHVGTWDARWRQARILAESCARISSRACRRIRSSSVSTAAAATDELAASAGSASSCASADPASRSLPLLLAGDMNADAASPALQVLRAAGFIDCYGEALKSGGEKATAAGDIGAAATCHGFKGQAHTSALGRIDWVLRKGPVHATDSEIVRDSAGGRYPSDHYFIVADVSLGRA